MNKCKHEYEVLDYLVCATTQKEDQRLKVTARVYICLKCKIKAYYRGRVISKIYEPPKLLPTYKISFFERLRHKYIQLKK